MATLRADVGATSRYTLVAEREGGSGGGGAGGRRYGVGGLAFWLITRLLYFSGGSTTKTHTKNS